MLTTDAIRKQLDRVVASQTFATAGRHRRLLQYLVTRTLDGEADRLKEYVVATEVFDRPDSYDPRLDSIVRVEVRRLRRRLETYYRGPGAADPVVISVPRGSYVPEFSAPMAPSASGPSRPAALLWASPASSGGRRRMFVALAAGVATVLVAMLALYPSRTVSAGPALVPGIAVLPFEPYSSHSDYRWLAGRVTDAVMSELARLGTVSVASRASTTGYVADARGVGELAAALNVAYVLEASAVVRDGRLRVVARLVDAASDRKIWVQIYEGEPTEVDALALRVATDVATFTVTHHQEKALPRP